MKQYEFEAITPTGRTERIRCTAANPEWARAQIAYSYSSWTIAQAFCDAHPAHHFLGEIDASEMDADDYEWITRTA